ncbi:unnamed protein product, partial [Scytosiphon promiscuus]
GFGRERKALEKIYSDTAAAMPKHKKEKAGPGMRHQPLAAQMASDGSTPRPKGARKSVAGSKRSKKAAAAAASSARRGRGGGNDEDDDDGDGYLPPKMTKRILEQAREQRDEMDEENEEGEEAEE